MFEDQTIQGRWITANDLEQIKLLITANQSWSRRRLSIEIAQAWNWRNGAGQLKDIAARTLFRKLEERGWIKQPQARGQIRRRQASKRWIVETSDIAESAIESPLAALQPLRIEIVHRKEAAGRQMADYLVSHHYLGYHGPVGENLAYGVWDAQGRWLACVEFGAAAWSCAPRDQFIGWSREQRQQRLSLIANNNRFLVLPWVKVPQLASHLLGRISQRIDRDWQCKYGHGLWMLETFVERDRFAGICYQAANWSRVGQTRGRSRQDRPDGTYNQVPIKEVYLYPLQRNFRKALAA
jgi:hypothetical protein